MKLSKLIFTTKINTTKRPYAYILVYTPTPPSSLHPRKRLKTHPTTDRATFRIPHITHHSAVTFCTFHSAFYLTHSACRNSVFYQQPHGPLSRRCLRATDTRRDTGPWRCSSDGTDDETRLIACRYVVRHHVFNLTVEVCPPQNILLRNRITW